MSRVLLLWVLPLAGQTPADLFTKAPPPVDEALRERVRRFYQAHTDGKWRQADQMVAEDSKDVFFEADKRRYKSCEIARIDYSEEFRKARVLVSCEGTMLIGVGGSIPVKIPVTSDWKVIDGEWFWYVTSGDGAQRTPFGVMRPGSGAAGGSAPAGAAAVAQGVEMAKQGRVVELEASEVELPAAGGAREIAIRNRMPGTVTLELEKAAVPGVTAALDPAQVPAGGSAMLKIAYTPGAKPVASAEVRVRVQPLGQVLVVKVSIAGR